MFNVRAIDVVSQSLFSLFNAQCVFATPFFFCFSTDYNNCGVTCRVGGHLSSSGDVFFFLSLFNDWIRCTHLSTIQYNTMQCNATSETCTDYLRGLLASSITILCFFVLWSLLLLAFKCFGSRRPNDLSNKTRWLAGKPFRVDLPPTVSEEKDPDAHASWQQQYRKVKKTLYIFRAFVLFAGTSIVISAIVMSVSGTNSLTQTLDSARTSIGLVHGLATEAIEIIDSVIIQNERVSDDIFKLLEDVNTMCPLVRDPLCDDLTDLSTCDISAFLGDDLDSIFQMAIGHFSAGERSVVYQEIIKVCTSVGVCVNVWSSSRILCRRVTNGESYTGFSIPFSAILVYVDCQYKARAGLTDAQDIAMSIDEKASHFNWALYLSMVMSLLLAVLCIFIMTSLVWRMPKMMTCLQSKIVMPVFVLLVCSAYVFALVFVIASTSTADICINESPDDNIDVRILTLLDRFRETLSPIVVDFAGFYIKQCPVDVLPQEIAEQVDYVLAGVPVIQQFSAIVEESTDLIQGVCGFAAEDSQRLVAAGDVVQVQLCEIAAILRRVRLFFQCENWFPLYETTVYQALCYDGTDGFAYVASTQFVIVCMAFLIVTLRTAFWDVQIGDDEEVEAHKKDVADDGTKSKEGEAAAAADKVSERYYSGIRNLLGSKRAKKEASVSEAEATFPDDLLGGAAGPVGQTIEFNMTPSTPNTTSMTFSSNNNTTINLSSEDNSFLIGEDGAHLSERSSTEEDLDESGDFVLDHHDDFTHGVLNCCGSLEETGEETGIEVEHFATRSDAWAIWARQFAGGWSPADDDDDDKDDNMWKF